DGRRGDGSVGGHDRRWGRRGREERGHPRRRRLLDRGRRSRPAPSLPVRSLHGRSPPADRLVDLALRGHPAGLAAPAVRGRGRVRAALWERGREPVSDPRLRILGIADARYAHTSKWANYFAGRGHEVHLVSFAPRQPVKSRLHPAVSIEDWTLPLLHLKKWPITLRALVRLRRIY